MKKVLFVCASMKVGGAEKSLLNLLNILDYNKYSVDLVLLQKQGEFLNQIPQEVSQLDCGKRMKALYDKVPWTFGNVCLKGLKYFATGILKLRYKAYDELRAHRWKIFYQHICEPLPKRYDVAVAFQSGESSYFVMDKVTADRKVTYFHTDIANIRLAYDLELQYLQRFDLVVTISNKCVASICKQFPPLREKTVCLNNPSSSKMITRMAGDVVPEEYTKQKQQIILVSVGRLVDIKGYDMAIEAARLLVDQHLPIQWFFVGEGAERNKLEKQIEKLGLKEHCHLLGIRKNPYPYIKFADVLVQSSRYEGKSVVLDEAKILGTPIVVTNYKSVVDQIMHGENGLIADMSGKGIAEQLLRLLEDHALYAMIKDNYREIGYLEDAAIAANYCDTIMGK